MKIILAMRGPFRGFRPKDDPREGIPTLLRKIILSVIPGWSGGPDPESRDSGFDAPHRPGMTATRSRRHRTRHVQERPRHVPEQLPVDRQRHRMRGAGQDDELAIAVRQLVEELLQIG